MTDLAAERKEYTEKFEIPVDSAIERLNNKTGALVFRHRLDGRGRTSGGRLHRRETRS